MELWFVRASFVDRSGCHTGGGVFSMALVTASKGCPVEMVIINEDQDADANIVSDKFP